MLIKIKGKKALFICVAVNGLLGSINLLLNYQSLMDSVGESKVKFAAAFATCFIFAFVVQVAYVIALNLILYFSAAAVNKGFDFKALLGLSTRAMILTPYLTLTDTIGFIIFGKKLVSFGVIGLLSYIPFYLFVGSILYKLLPRYLDLTHKQRMTISIIAGLLMIGVSYPYV